LVAEEIDETSSAEDVLTTEDVDYTDGRLRPSVWLEADGAFLGRTCDWCGVYI